MASNNLIMNNEWAKVFAGLPDEKAGQLVKAVFAIHEGQEVQMDDPVLSAVLDMIGSVVIDRKEKYEETCRRNAENGRKGGEAKASNSKRNVATASESKRNVANKIKEKEIKEKDIKKFSYGEYKKVLLTEEEYKKLCSEFGEQETDKAISFLDSYIAEKGYKSKSHYLAIRRWVFDAIQKPTARSGTKFQNFPARDDTEHKEMVARIIAIQ